MRRPVLPGILILLVGSLAACTPPDEPIAALAAREGRPVGVLVACGGEFSQLGVFENDERSNMHGSPFVTWRVSGTPAADGVVEVPLLDPAPAGWQVEEPRDLSATEAGLPVDVEPLAELEPDVRYSLSGSSRSRAISVDFTLADLDRIGSDQVLAPKNNRTTKIMSRDAFVRRARGACD